MAIEFDNEQFRSYSQLQPQKPPTGLLGALLSSGIAKTPEQANKILVGIFIITIMITGTMLYYMFRPGPKLSASEKKRIQESAKEMQMVMDEYRNNIKN